MCVCLVGIFLANMLVYALYHPLPLVFSLGSIVVEFELSSFPSPPYVEYLGERRLASEQRERYCGTRKRNEENKIYLPFLRFTSV